MEQPFKWTDFGPIIAADGANYGFELTAYGRDDLDHHVDEHLSSAGRQLHILDIGGASGFRAEQFAQNGHSVTVVDICDSAPAISARNTFNLLGRTPISFYQGDAADLEKLSPVITQQWQLIHARRLVHWMPFEDVSRFLSFLPNIADSGCMLALCFQTAKRTPGTLAAMKSTHNLFYHHAPQDVLSLMTSQGYTILEHGGGTRTTDRSYQILARIHPEVR